MTFKYLGANINRNLEKKVRVIKVTIMLLTRYNIKKQVYKLKQDKNIQNIMQYKGYIRARPNDLCH